jgi:predicted DsbA family dithiol-disulfide isomerase
VRLAQEIARLNPSVVTADMVDAHAFGGLADALRVGGVPTTVINRRERVFGVVPPAVLWAAVRRALTA